MVSRAVGFNELNSPTTLVLGIRRSSDVTPFVVDLLHSEEEPRTPTSNPNASKWLKKDVSSPELGSTSQKMALFRYICIDIFT